MDMHAFKGRRLAAAGFVAADAYRSPEVGRRYATARLSPYMANLLPELNRVLQSAMPLSVPAAH